MRGLMPRNRANFRVNRQKDLERYLRGVVLLVPAAGCGSDVVHRRVERCAKPRGESVDRRLYDPSTVSHDFRRFSGRRHEYGSSARHGFDNRETERLFTQRGRNDERRFVHQLERAFVRHHAQDFDTGDVRGRSFDRIPVRSAAGKPQSMSSTEA